MGWKNSKLSCPSQVQFEKHGKQYTLDGKPRGKELVPEEKEDNRLISKIRIRIEHAIGGVKRYRIVKDKIRNWKQGFRESHGNVLRIT
jgi:hypothetical protein